MTEIHPPYALVVRVRIPYEQADERVRRALQEEGFGVLTEIDVAATLKKKLGVDMPWYEILGACAPPLAHRALLAEPDIGLLLPCNVVVREAEPAGTTIVEALDPVIQLGVADNDALKPLALEVRVRMERVLERVAAG